MGNGLRQRPVGVEDGQDADESVPDGERALRAVAVGGSRSLAMAFANAPDGRTHISTFHDLGIVLSEPRTQVVTAASRALDVASLAEIPVEYLRL
jgi:hypothetical protein